jgi:hypothetical protein
MGQSLTLVREGNHFGDVAKARSVGSDVSQPALCYGKPKPPDSPPSVDFLTVNPIAVLGQPITLNGSTDGGTTHICSADCKCWDERPLATFTAVRVTQDDGTTSDATSVGGAWSSWSAPVVFTVLGLHTATATGTSDRGQFVSSVLAIDVVAPPPVVVGPRFNRQVTCDSDPNNDRSESDLVVNPLDPLNLLGASKRFTDPAHYAFSLATYATFDGGQTWTESSLVLPTIAGQTVVGLSDPTLCFDDVGNAYLLGLVMGAPLPSFLGMAVYMSSDGGRNWGLPNRIFGGGDKQAMAADTSRTSPHKGRIYAAWDGSSGGIAGVLFARSIDHGTSWTGGFGTTVGNPTIIPGGLFSSISIASDGTVWVFALTIDTGGAIVYVTSTDGGDTFSAVQPAAVGIRWAWSLPNHPFRAETIPSSCANRGQVVVAWADGRDGDVHVYYRRTDTSGQWLGSPSGDLITAQSPSEPGQGDFMPQMACTPNGEIACCFYEYGVKATGGPPLISVEVVVSTDGASSFPHRATVTDRPWDPTVDIVTDTSGDHFIGDYFGFTASQLGLFPFWTDTRTNVQEIFTSRLAIRPADVFIRDSTGDTGSVPSPGDHSQSPDLIVCKSSTLPTSWTSDPLVHDGKTDFFVYGRATNLGPNAARNVRLAVSVGDFPGVLGMPGGEFRYPQDWYPGDWNSPDLNVNHRFLGESAPVDIPTAGGTVTLGPVRWSAEFIPAKGTHDPRVLAEVRTDNDDSAGGVEGSPLQVGTPCNPGSFFWGVNDASQLNPAWAGCGCLGIMMLLLGLTFLAGVVLESVLQTF